MPRTAGFNSIDYADAEPATLLVTDVLMFIGGGSGGTAGGIKVTTFALLGYVLWSVVRGDTAATAFRRTIPPIVVRQAITVVLLGIGAVFGTTLALLALSDFTLAQTLFEATSAFGTVGLTMGITPELNGVAQGLLMVLMLTGRVGAVTIVTALALPTAARAALATQHATGEALSADHSRVARAMGLPERAVQRRAARVALPERAAGLAGDALGLALSLSVIEGLLQFPGVGNEVYVALQGTFAGADGQPFGAQSLSASLAALLGLALLFAGIGRALAARLDPRPRAGASGAEADA